MQSKVTLTFWKIELKSILQNDFQSKIVKHFQNIRKKRGGGGRGPLGSSPKSAYDLYSLSFVWSLSELVHFHQLSSWWSAFHTLQYYILKRLSLRFGGYMTLNHFFWKYFQSKVCIRANVAHQAGAYPGFRSMKRLGVFLLPPGWDASPSQGYPPALSLLVPIYMPGWREALWE